MAETSLREVEVPRLIFDPPPVSIEDPGATEIASRFDSGNSCHLTRCSLDPFEYLNSQVCGAELDVVEKIERTIRPIP